MVPDAPLIVVFGARVGPDGHPSRALSRRVAQAWALGGAGGRYLVTGAAGAQGPSEASVMARLLSEYGVPPERIECDAASGDTLASVREVARRMRGRTVLVSTSAYHLPRCLLLLRLAGVHAWPVPTDGERAARGGLRAWYWRGREVPAIIWDAALLIRGRASK